MRGETSRRRALLPPTELRFGRDELVLRGAARSRHRVENAAALGRNVLVRRSPQSTLQLVTAVAGEYHVGVGVDETGHHGAAPCVDTHGATPQRHVFGNGIRGTYEDDPVIERGDDTPWNRRDLAKCCAAPRCRAGTRHECIGALDQEIGLNHQRELWP